MTDFDGHAESYAAYKDESGNPLLVLSSVLFFDLLGVQDMARAPDAEQKLIELRVALREAIKQSQIDHPWSLQVSSWFTDNAVVAQPQQTSEHSESLIGGLEIVAADLLVHCWIRGFLGRGAITYGDHHISDRFVSVQRWSRRSTSRRKRDGLAWYSAQTPSKPSKSTALITARHYRVPKADA